MAITVAVLEVLLLSNTGRFLAGIRQADRSLNDFASGAQATLRSVGTAFTVGLTVPIIAALGLYAKAAIDFENSFANVRKTVEGTRGELDQLAVELRQLAIDASSPVSSLDNAQEELVKIAEIAGQLGVPIENIGKFTEQLGLLAIAAPVKIEKATLQLAQFLNVANEGFGDIDRLVAAIVELGNNFAATENNIIGTVQRFGAVGARLRITADQMLAIATIVSATGSSVAAGGTAIQRLFSRFESALTGNTEFLNEFARVSGRTAEQFIQDFGTDLPAVLVDFFKGLDAAEALDPILDILKLNTQRTKLALAGLAQGSDLLADAFSRAGRQFETPIAAFIEGSKKAETTASKFHLLENTFRELRITIGNELLPFINVFLAALTRIVNKVAEIDTATIRFALAIGIAAASIGPAILLLSAFLGALTSIPGLVTLAVGAFAINFGGIRDTIFRVFGPGTVRVINELKDAINDFFGVLFPEEPEFDIVKFLGLDSISPLLNVENLSDTAVLNLIKFGSSSTGRQIFLPIDIILGDTASGIFLDSAFSEELRNFFTLEGFLQEVEKITGNRNLIIAGTTLQIPIPTEISLTSAIPRGTIITALQFRQIEEELARQRAEFNKSFGERLADAIKAQGPTIEAALRELGDRITAATVKLFRLGLDKLENSVLPDFAELMGRFLGSIGIKVVSFISSIPKLLATGISEAEGQESFFTILKDRFIEGLSSSFPTDAGDFEVGATLILGAIVAALSISILGLPGLLLAAGIGARFADGTTEQIVAAIGLSVIGIAIVQAIMSRMTLAFTGIVLSKGLLLGVKVFVNTFFNALTLAFLGARVAIKFGLSVITAINVALADALLGTTVSSFQGGALAGAIGGFVKSLLLAVSATFVAILLAGELIFGGIIVGLLIADLLDALGIIDTGDAENAIAEWVLNLFLEALNLPVAEELRVSIESWVFRNITTPLIEALQNAGLANIIGRILAGENVLDSILERENIDPTDIQGFSGPTFIGPADPDLPPLDTRRRLEIEGPDKFEIPRSPFEGFLPKIGRKFREVTKAIADSSAEQKPIIDRSILDMFRIFSEINLLGSAFYIYKGLDTMGEDISLRVFHALEILQSDEEVLTRDFANVFKNIFDAIQIEIDIAIQQIRDSFDSLGVIVREGMSGLDQDLANETGRGKRTSRPGGKPIKSSMFGVSKINTRSPKIININNPQFIGQSPQDALITLKKTGARQQVLFA